MSERTQFTFYISFFEAISRIKKAADRAAAYDVLAKYALFGEEPDIEKMPDSVAIAYFLMKPTLDKSREKAAAGKRGGEVSKPQANRKQTESKTEANSKQTEANRKRGETGSEKEKEGEKENEKESYTPFIPLRGGAELQRAFSEWLAYKQERREGYKPTGLKALTTELENHAARCGEAAVVSVIRMSMANGWRGIAFDRLPKVPTAAQPSGMLGDLEVAAIRRFMGQANE